MAKSSFRNSDSKWRLSMKIFTSKEAKLRILGSDFDSQKACIFCYLAFRWSPTILMKAVIFRQFSELITLWMRTFLMIVRRKKPWNSRILTCGKSWKSKQKKRFSMVENLSLYWWKKWFSRIFKAYHTVIAYFFADSSARQNLKFNDFCLW